MTANILFLLAVLALAVSGVVVFVSVRKVRELQQTAKDLGARAELEAEKQRQEILLAAKDEALRIRQETEREIKDQKNEVGRYEKRLQQKEETIDRKIETLDRRDEDFRTKEQRLKEREEDLDSQWQRHKQELERIAGMSAHEAKQALLSKLEGELQQEMSQMIRHAEMEAREQSEKKARGILSTAIQRCAVDHVTESTVSVVTLVSDEMKGRIIGREGRNIRALEAATGVELIIDDTPEAVIISGFDPIRREVCRVALEKLLGDGRIHPTRIEEVVEKARQEVDDRIKEEGDAAMLEMGMTGVHPEIVKTFGRLRFRTSYGQNILLHSKEVSYLCGIIAAELKANVAIAKRAGLFHDIGKALTHLEEGTHTEIGVDILTRFGERPEIIHAVAAHHNDIPPETIEAVIVQIADALSSARPGARRDSLENYFKRMQKLEEIAHSFPGIEKTFAIQAGREIRVLVQPEVVSDSESPRLARDIAKRIESEMQYPGQVKVTVIRETRTTEYAK